ncbi:MAG: response regulator [Rubrivivax sp.]
MTTAATARAAIERAVRLSGIADGGEIVGAANGKAALELMNARPFTLALVDLHMPEMGGVELTQQMGTSERLRNIPVVIVSAEPSTTKLDALKVGCVKNYIRKPFTPEAIRKVITEMLEVSRAA